MSAILVEPRVARLFHHDCPRTPLDTQQFQATLTLRDGTTRLAMPGEVLWAVSSDVLSIDQTGLVRVTPNGGSSASVLASLAANGRISDRVEVLIGFADAFYCWIEIHPATARVELGATQRLGAAATGPTGMARAIDGEVQWTSRDPAVATIDSTGVVRGLTPGVATIVATASPYEPGMATVTVTVPHAGVDASADAIGSDTAPDALDEASDAVDP